MENEDLKAALKAKDKTTKSLIIALIATVVAFCALMGFFGAAMTQILLNDEFMKGYNASNVMWAYHINGVKLPVNGKGEEKK